MKEKRKPECIHDLVKERDHGMDTGDKVCRMCGKTFTPAEAKALKVLSEATVTRR
jgi:hypothetical protein